MSCQGQTLQLFTKHLQITSVKSFISLTPGRFEVRLLRRRTLGRAPDVAGGRRDGLDGGVNAERVAEGLVRFTHWIGRYSHIDGVRNFIDVSDGIFGGMF
jgi:hypothetical protein